MKKLKWIPLCALLAAGSLWGQPTDKEKKEVEIAIEDNRVIIEAEDMSELSQLDLNQILREVAKRSQMVMKQRQELLAKVEEQLAKGEITEEQADEMREMINERTEESMETIGEFMEVWGDHYEERMEAWEAEYEAKIAEWEAEVEARSEAGEFVVPPFPPLPEIPAAPAVPGDNRKVIINEDGITIRNGKDGEEPFAFRFENEDHDRHREHGEDHDDDDDDDDDDHFDATDSYFDIHFGFNQQLDGGSDFLTSGAEELNFWKSTAFELGMGAKTRIGSPASKLYIKYGGEFSWHNFRLTDDNIIMKGSDSVMFGESALYRNIDKSKYHVAYFNVPVMLQLDFSDVGDRDEAFTLGVGGYAGVRINAKRKLEYQNEAFRDIEEKSKSDFFINQFRYGLMSQIGFGSFKITGKYDLNSFFEKDKGPDYQMAAIMVGFTW